MPVCKECGYNLPHHGPRCPASPERNATPFCPAHAPTTKPFPSDDQQLTCATCGTRGYNVKRFPQTSG